MTALLDKGLLIYYFNIIMIASIVLMVLIIGYNRTKKVVVNVGERSRPIEKNSNFYKGMFLVVYFGLAFFTIREIGTDWITDIIDFIKELF